MGEVWFRRFLALNVVLGLVFAFLLVREVSRPRGGGGGLASEGSPVGMGEVTLGPEPAVGGGGSAEAGAGPRGGSRGPLARGGPARAGEGLGGGVIVFGGIFTETGPIDSRPEEHSVRAVFQEVNAAGGIYGRTLQLEARDDGWDPTRAQAQARELVEERQVFAFVGNLAPNSESAFVPYLAEKGVPVVGGLGVPAEEGKPAVFLTFPALSKQARLAGRVSKIIGCNRPAIWVLDLPFTRDLAPILAESLRRAGCEPAGDPEIISATQPDYTPYVVKARAQGAQGVLLALDPGGIYRAISAIRRQGWNVPISLGTPSNTQIEAYLGEAMEGVFMTSAFLNPEAHPNHPGVKRWLATIRKYYPGDFTDPYTQQSYISALITVEALKRVGPSLSRAAFVAALESIKGFDSGLALPFTYSRDNHDPLQCLEVLQRKGGRWQVFHPRWVCLDGSDPPLP